MKTKGYYSSGSVSSNGGPPKLHHLNDNVSSMNSPKESVLVRYLRSGTPADLHNSSSPHKSRTIVNYNYHKQSGSSSNSTKSPLSAVESLKDDVLVMDGILVDSTNSASKTSAKFRSPDSSSISGSIKAEFCMPWEKENSESFRYNYKFQFEHGQNENRSIPNRVRNKIKWELMVTDPYYSPQSSSYSSHSSIYNSARSSTYSSPQSSNNRFPLDAMATPPPNAANSKFNTALPVLSKDGPTISPNLISANWSPLDDGIAVKLPSSDETSSRKAVDEHIQSVLYGPTQKKRLPCFVDIYPN